jgi:hypothetical protein
LFSLFNYDCQGASTVANVVFCVGNSLFTLAIVEDFDKRKKTKTYACQGASTVANAVFLRWQQSKTLTSVKKQKPTIVKVQAPLPTQSFYVGNSRIL